jgi:hypothetical protein
MDAISSSPLVLIRTPFRQRSAEWTAQRIGYMERPDLVILLIQ